MWFVDVNSLQEPIEEEILMAVISLFHLLKQGDAFEEINVGAEELTVGHSVRIASPVFMKWNGLCILIMGRNSNIHSEQLLVPWQFLIMKI